jgi:hypothetical protein
MLNITKLCNTDSEAMKRLKVTCVNTSNEKLRYNEAFVAFRAPNQKRTNVRQRRTKSSLSTSWQSTLFMTLNLPLLHPALSPAAMIG